MFNDKSKSSELVARWKTVIDESNPAGLIELDDLDNFLGGDGAPLSGATEGCSTTATACCTCIGGTSCC